jgi:cytoplasmic iron level regulating protein YaaA (DUF328/UPF0246 family)
VLILLPPSEGKTAPPPGDPIDLDSLVFADALGARRERLLAALERLASISTARALKQLDVSKGQVGEIAVDAALRTAPAAAASGVYSGVLYDHLGLPGLPAEARRQVLIASALWGVLRPDDRIPYYRFSAKARLGRIGAPAAYWRQALAAALPDEPDELVVDMRSGAYAAAWKPKRAKLLAVRAFSESEGKRKPVSHMAKAVRGEVARALLLAKQAPVDPEAAAAIAECAGFKVELAGTTLDIVVPASG